MSSHLTWDLPIRTGPLPGVGSAIRTQAKLKNFTHTEPRGSAVQPRQGPVTRSQRKIAAKEKDALKPRGSSLLSDSPASLSPLDLGSPNLGQISSSSLSGSLAITSNFTDTLDSMVLDQNASISKSSGIISDSLDTLGTEISTDVATGDMPDFPKQRSLYQRLVSGSSYDDRPFERSSCPSPTASFQYEADNVGACTEHTKGTHWALEAEQPTNRVVKSLSVETTQSVQEGESSRDVIPTDRSKNGERSVTDENLEEKMSSAMGILGSSRFSSGSFSFGSVERTPEIVTKDEHRKFSTFCRTMSGFEDQPHHFSDLWKDAYVRQLATPEPLRVFPALLRDETTPVTNDNEDVDTVDRGRSEQNDRGNRSRRNRMSETDIPEPDDDIKDREAWLERLRSADSPDNAYYRILRRWTFQGIREYGSPQTTARHIRNSYRQRTEAGDFIISEPPSPACDVSASDALASNVPDPIPCLDGDASPVDPSLEAGVYHHRRQVGSSTPEPVLQPTEEEPAASKPARAAESHGHAKASSPRQKKGKREIQPAHLSGEQSGSPSQTAAPIELQTMPPVHRAQAEEALEGQRAHRSPLQIHMNQASFQHSTEEGQTGSIHEWIAASTPPRPPRGYIVQPGQRRAATGSDEAGCCLCQCLAPLRSLCCGSRDQLTEDRLQEHMRTTGDPYVYGRGSTLVAGENGSRLKLGQHQGDAHESSAIAENSAPAAPNHSTDV